MARCRWPATAWAPTPAAPAPAAAPPSCPTPPTSPPRTPTPELPERHLEEHRPRAVGLEGGTDRTCRQAAVASTASEGDHHPLAGDILARHDCASYGRHAGSSVGGPR